MNTRHGHHIPGTEFEEALVRYRCGGTTFCPTCKWDLMVYKMKMEETTIVHKIYKDLSAREFAFCGAELEPEPYSYDNLALCRQCFKISEELPKDGADVPAA